MVESVRFKLSTMDSTTAVGTPWRFGPTLNSTSPGFKSSTVAPTIFPRAGYSILSYLMFINAIFSVFNNTLVITVLMKNRTLLNPMNVIILSLAVSDLMIALCGSSIVTITNYHGSFFLGDEFCIFQGFAVNYFGKVLHFYFYIGCLWIMWTELKLLIKKTMFCCCSPKVLKMQV